jgi:hypothetical protein
MANFSMNSWLDDITSLAKKLGVYENRFNITSEQMFGLHKKKGLSSIKVPSKDSFE